MKRSILISALIINLAACSDGLKELPPAPALNTQSDVPAMLRIGDRLLATGDAGKAMQLYTEALSQQPNNIAILMRLGDISWQFGAFDQAAGYYGQALSVDPDNIAALMGRARTMMAQGDPFFALKLIGQAEQKSIADAQILTTKGLALDLLGRQEDAQLAYAGALDINPNDALARANMALSFAISQDYHTAVEIVRGLSSTTAQIERSREILALIYALSGQIEPALELSVEPNQRAFFSRLPALKPAEKAAAVYFRRLPELKHEAPPPVVDFEMKDAPLKESPIVQPENRAEAELPQTAQAEALSEPVSSGAPAVTDEKPQRHYWAQVASFKAVEALDLAWAGAKRRLAKNTQIIMPLVQSITAEGETTSYRLMVGRFPTKAEAQARCDVMRAVKVDCVVIRNDLDAIPLEKALGRPAP